MLDIEIHKIVRSKRRSIALVMTPEAMLVVRAPHFAPLNEIRGMVEKHRDWIERKRALILKAGIPKPKQFIDGEEFLFLGEPHQLRIRDCREIELKEDLIFPKRHLAKAKQKLIYWYKEQAFEKITEIAQHYSGISGWKYKTIHINSARTRWGSCSTSGSINFSWKLIMAPFDVVEYVVVHELAHITEKNHSSRFWAKVKSILPEYKKQEKWLKDHGRHLVI